MESEPARPRTKPAWAQLLVTFAVILVFAGLYVGVMWLTVDSTRITADQTADDRDMVDLMMQTMIKIKCLWKMELARVH